jgi:hypothetical protein
MQKWDTLPSDDKIAATAAALTKQGIEVFIVADGAAAKAKALEILPVGAEVMTMTSTTANTIGLTAEINESGRFQAVKPQLMKMDRATQGDEMRKLGAGADWSVGSVHAVTEAGQVIIASATGSQLPGYAYGSARVLWVVGAQKIVTDMTAALQRLQEYTLPLESARSMKAYGEPSNINKMLTVNQERPGRITMILIKEVLGF